MVDLLLDAGTVLAPPMLDLVVLADLAGPPASEGALTDPATVAAAGWSMDMAAMVA